eukprot:CAMPEP_0201510368 /NCGR_PEP_ID=MMETSP0161_2-20130828/3083_1 /ASSEMBLY_ACC=CAM_ASM_000251 /TAXON_ID=180227 /ORGANISM="Neoparamoeba aestuarina, Strain SoJaBio B1-5/56/2" /LENGTH=446 /DNA_ID=CAMNT_0047905525 /DNA_START=174 /DNA_END=1514 /DNA_ORIENTATION=-
MIALAVIVFALAGVVVGGVSPAEKSALEDFYASLDGTQWIDNDNWNSGDPCDNTWFGVSCTSNHVTGLKLTKNNLQGSLPTTIGNIFDLETFQLSSNLISESIPTEIGLLRSLSLIDFSFNEISGIIPDVIGNLADFSLNSLDLSNNTLGGTVPEFFVTDANDFTYVNLSNNPFICPIPAGAEYTQATCLTIVIDEITTACFNNPYDTSKTTGILGSGFKSVPVVCLFGFEGKMEVMGAFVASDQVIYCDKPIFNFTGCTGREGEKLIGIGNVSLGMSQGNGYYQSVSNSLSTHFLNPICPFPAQGTAFSDSLGLYAEANGKSFVSYSGVQMKQTCLFPTMQDALAICEAGALLPYRCPAQFNKVSSTSQIPTPKLDVTCNDPTTCMWAPMTYCPWEYTPNTGICSDNAYSSYSYPPFKSTNDVSPCLGYIIVPNPGTHSDTDSDY